MLHITNGDGTAAILRRSSVAGQIVAFREALVAGPTPDGVDGEEWIVMRAAFLASEYDADPTECLAGLREWEITLAGLGAHDEVTLWFEHDLFCQTNLIAILACIRAGVAPERLSLVMIDGFPGVDDFRGLGQLSPADLETLFERRATVTDAQLDLAADAWRAYRSADPSAIEALLARDTSALPYLRAALVRHLARFPSTFNGLGAVERSALAAIEAGVTSFGPLFAAFSARESGYGYGDYQLWRDLEPLAAGPRPLLRIDGLGENAARPIASNAFHAATLAVTDDGRDVLAGRADAVALNGIDRWLGGVRLAPGRIQWRWDGEALAPPRARVTGRLVDLSHDVEEGMITYKGLPAPIICDFLSREASRDIYADGVEFHIGRIDMVANTGTYVDSPFHRYAHGMDLAELPLESLADLDGIVIRVDTSASRAIAAESLRGHDLRGRAVLVHTGWDRHWRTDAYFEGHPYLTRDAARYLVDAGAALVGIDSYNIDDTADMERPAHTIILGAAIPIAEHMCNLESIPDSGFRFHAAPVKVRRFGTFPVRAYAVLDGAARG